MFLNFYRYISMFCVFLQNFCDGNNMRWEEDLYFSALKHYCTKNIYIYIYIFYHHVLLKAPEQNSLSLTLFFSYFLLFRFFIIIFRQNVYLKCHQNTRLN